MSSVFLPVRRTWNSAMMLTAGRPPMVLQETLEELDMPRFTRKVALPSTRTPTRHSSSLQQEYEPLCASLHVRSAFSAIRLRQRVARGVDPTAASEQCGRGFRV